MNQNGETEIAIDMSCGTIFIERVNDVFQARAIMHEKVYQSGCATDSFRSVGSFSALNNNTAKLWDTLSCTVNAMPTLLAQS